MGTKSPGPPQRCQLILQQCLAIQLTKPGQTPDDFWMYDSGYMIFQNFLAANSKCWWNAPLTAATRSLKYAGHVAPGMLLVTAEPCALEILRGAYARSVLKPPATYVISSVGDIDDCVIQPTLQTQFTPLPEALCDVIMDLTSQGQSATLENIKAELGTKFPHMQQPSTDIIYDALAQLMQERKIYQTSKGYFIVTPERRRSRSRPRGHPNSLIEQDDEPYDSRTILMTNSEALHSLYGEITTERDGDLTHQCIQTNLADVICGGNPNDKILYPRASKRRSASFPTPRSLERRHSLRLFGSSKRLQRCASTRTFSFRSLSKNYAQTLTTDSSSSEYQSTDSSSPKKSASLLSRLFRRSGRSKQKNIQTYAGQFPPAEWFNSKAVHLHSVGTQTLEHDVPGHTLSSSTFYAASEVSSQRSLTLPRRHRRHLSSESTFLISSRDCSPIRRRSPQCYSGSLPRSTHSIPNSARSPKRQPLLGKAPEDATRAKSAAEVYKNRNAVDTKIASEREKHKSIYSGPSSLESGKTSGGCIASGPSSIESGRFPYSRTSGHSSLDSQASSSATTVTTSQSPVRSSIIKPAASRKMSPADIEIGLPSSQSSNSITLQVNSSSSAMPSTKIFVQNSPVRSVITFENGKLSDNSNVYIINSEKTTHANGEVTTHKSVSRQGSGPKLAPKATCSDCEEEESLSLISETSPDSSLTVNNDFEVTKFTKNINNENVTMNNNRKLNSHLPQNGGNFVYKNVLKDVPSSPTSPNNKNFFGDTKTYEQMAGSVGNLRQLDSQPKKLNSNVDLKTMVVVENNLKLQNTNMSMMNLLRKNSEPNLSVKTIEKQKIADATKKDNIDRRMSLSKDQRQQQTEQENAGSNYTFPSLTDLSFNFTSIAAQKILQGVSINSIDTLCELNLQSHQEKAAATQPNGTNICTDYGMV